MKEWEYYLIRQHLGNLRELNIEDNQLESEWLEIVKKNSLICQS